MEAKAEGSKTKTLAVFENVVAQEKHKKRKFTTHKFSDDDSSPSESDDTNSGPKRKKSGIRIRLKEESLCLKCGWQDCFEVYTDEEAYFKHILTHASGLETAFESLICRWTDCPNSDNITSNDALRRHIAYHGYLEKLVNVGENVLQRNNFPECFLEKNYSVKVPLNGYVCEWDKCDFLLINTIDAFLSHVECHVRGVPSGKKKGSNEVISCQWGGCSAKFSTRYKLSDHMRIHTKERTIACPKCFCTFTTKTIFSDHRKRQLKTDMRSYQCSQCLKLFSIEKLLSDHMRSHINQYKCSLCDMTSPKPSMLAKHYRYRHLKERPFSCQLCPKTFVTKSNLNNHLWTHQEKPFKCDQCEFGCKSRVGLRSHMAKVHGSDCAQYECQVCKHRFKRGVYLTYHLIKIHKFHWPSGHCRFRYRKDSDGIHRLQTVRYESLEVTEEVIKSESMQSKKHSSAVTYNVTFDDKNEFNLNVSEGVKFEGQTEIEVGPVELIDTCQTDANPVIIVIEDVDEMGNVLRSSQFNSSELVLYYEEEPKLDDKKALACRDMPLFEANIDC